MCRVLIFNTAADAVKCLTYVQARALGDIDMFTTLFPEYEGNLQPAEGLPHYAAVRWASLDDCKHHTDEQWAIPMNDSRVDLMIAQHPHIRTELLDMFPDVEFSEVENTFWRLDPELPS